MLQALSAQEVVTEENRKLAEQAELEGKMNDRWVDTLAGHIRAVFERNKRHRDKEITERLKKCLRMKERKYDAKTKAAIAEMGGSDIYVPIANTKMRACAAWVQDILMPANEQPWGIESTPLPEMPPEIEQAIFAEAMNQAVQEAQASGDIQDFNQLMQVVESRKAELTEEVTKEANLQSKKFAEKMEKKIEDQLAESNWLVALKEFIDDFSTYPAAIIKGPILKKKRAIEWNGKQPVTVLKETHDFKRVSAFDCFPAPGAVKMEDGDFIERTRYSRGSIYNLRGLPGYKDEAITNVLEEYDKGHHESAFDNNDEHESNISDYDNYGLIDGLHFWGSAQGRHLLEWGVNPLEIDDELAEYQIDAILIGRHVIRCVINNDPLNRRPYQKASYQNVPGDWWGIAPCELMEDIERMCNSTARALANNLALSSGPMMGILEDRLHPGDDPTNMHPFKTFRFRSGVDGFSGGKENPIQFFQPRSNAPDLLNVYEQFERRADDATGIPRYSYGNQQVGGAAATKGGLSMLMEAAAKGIRAAISNVDMYVIRPAIEQLWFHNMVYDPDVELKHDVQVVARGTAALIAKEQQRAQKLEFLQLTANPIDMEIIGVEGRAKVLKDYAREMDLGDVVPTSEQIQQKQIAQAQEQQPDPEQEKAMAELALKEKEIDNKYEIDKADLALDEAELSLKYSQAIQPS